MTLPLEAPLNLLLLRAMIVMITKFTKFSMFPANQDTNILLLHVLLHDVIVTTKIAAKSWWLEVDISSDFKTKFCIF